jgi:hypothetical protein
VIDTYYWKDSTFWYWTTCGRVCTGWEAFSEELPGKASKRGDHDQNKKGKEYHSTEVCSSHRFPLQVDTQKRESRS